MKFLVTGAGGQLGIDLVTAAKAAGHEVVGTDRAALDITDARAVAAQVSSAAPEVVVNCAAHTGVDACETEVERAHAINADGVANVRDAAASVGAHLVHVSTDYVFDGSKTEPYHEGDEPNPASVYGQSKLAGEQLLGPDATIVRTSWVCGANGANMVKTILRLAGEHDTLTFVDDQRGHPTFTADLATMLLRLGTERRGGLFHVTNQGAVSWFEFAQAVLEAAGDDPSRVGPCTTAEFPRPAPRPANSVLENRALADAGIPLLRDFREPLAEVVAQLTA